MLSTIMCHYGARLLMALNKLWTLDINGMRGSAGNKAGKTLFLLKDVLRCIKGY